MKNTLISIATYAKALKSEGANLYSFVEDVDAVGIIEAALRSANITENSLRTYWGKICILLLIHPMCLPLWLRHCRKLILGQWMFVLSLFVRQMHLNLFS